MQRTFSFHCATCGKSHEGSPSLAFSSPYYWQDGMQESPAGDSKLNDDFCMIERRDYFIRCILEIGIHDVEEPFLWGVWITQSEKNFHDYAATFPNSPERQTFGYFANRLPGYPDTLNLHCQVHWRSGRDRPWVGIAPSDHDLYRDWHEGISWERAVELAVPILHPANH